MYKRQTPFRAQWPEVPDDEVPANGFRAQWEQFVRHLHDDAEHPYDLLAGARGLRLAEAGLASSRDGRRVELDEELR